MSKAGKGKENWLGQGPRGENRHWEQRHGGLVWGEERKGVVPEGKQGS